MKEGFGKIRILYMLFICLTHFILPNKCLGQRNIFDLSALINEISFSMPDGLGDSIKTEYTFIHAGCFCSISQATTGKKDRMNTISTYSFNLSELKNVRILVSKPRDSDFLKTNQDIWRIEMGVFNILVQNTNWQSQQTKTNHFYLNVETATIRDRVIELVKKSVEECGGKITEVTILDN